MQSGHQWVNCGSWSKGSKPSKYWQPTIGILKKCIMTWVPSPQTPFAAHLSCSNFRISLLIYIFSNAQTTVWLTHLPRAVQRLGKALTDASTIHSGFHGGYRLQVLHIPASAMHDKKPCLACSENLFFGTFHRTGLYYCSNGRSKSVGGRIERWATSKQEWVCNLINLLHFLLDWTFACPETWIRYFMHKVLIWKETPTNSRSDVKTTAWSGTFRSTTRRVSQLLLEKSSSSDIARTILF